MPTAKLVSLATALFLPLFAVPAATAPAELGIVTPATDCATLAETDMTAIGGEGSRIDAASETESGGVPVCSVEGTLTPRFASRSCCRWKAGPNGICRSDAVGSAGGSH